MGVVEVISLQLWVRDRGEIEAFLARVAADFDPDVTPNIERYEQRGDYETISTMTPGEIAALLMQRIASGEKWALKYPLIGGVAYEVAIQSTQPRSLNISFDVNSSSRLYNEWRVPDPSARLAAFGKLLGPLAELITSVQWDWLN